MAPRLPPCPSLAPSTAPLSSHGCVSPAPAHLRKSHRRVPCVPSFSIASAAPPCVHLPWRLGVLAQPSSCSWLWLPLLQLIGHARLLPAQPLIPSALLAPAAPSARAPLVRAFLRPGPAPPPSHAWALPLVAACSPYACPISLSHARHGACRHFARPCSASFPWQFFLLDGAHILCSSLSVVSSSFLTARAAPGLRPSSTPSLLAPVPLCLALVTALSACSHRACSHRGLPARQHLFKSSRLAWPWSRPGF
jgi:hypothetical protein